MAFKMTTLNNCSLCYNDFDEEAPSYSSKLSELCCKYLHSAFTQEILINQSSDKTLLLCPKCFESAVELAGLNDQIEFYQKRISELVLILSLEILHRRGQTTVSSDNKTDNAKSVKNLIEFDVSSLPNFDYWNNSSTSKIFSFTPIDKIQTSEIFFEEELSDRMHLPVMPAGENNSLDDVVIEEMKCENYQQDYIDENVDEMYNTSNTEFSSSFGKEREEIKRISTIPTENNLPTLKLQRLQFHDNESKVIAVEIETDDVIGVNDEIGKIKVETVWTRSEFGGCYRNTTINKNSSFEINPENADLLYHSAISNVASNCMDVSSFDGQITTTVGQQSSFANSSSFDSQHCNLTSSGENQFQCPVCNKMFCTKSILMCHKKEVHTEERLHSCEVCKKRFKHKHHLLYHSRMHTGEKPYKCDVCNRRFSHKCNMSIHKKVHTGGKMHKYNFSEKKSSRSHLLLHTKCHSAEVIRPVKYGDPDSISNCSHSLKVHRIENHLRSTNGYSCDLCKKSFKTKQNLLLHERVHTGEKPYSCDVCDKRFAYKHTMLQHKSLHTGEKPYKCDICDRRFAQQSTFSIHKKVHTGEKLYKCDICDRRFTQQSNMLRHKMLHTGEKPYKCDFCYRRFAHKNAMLNHKMLHTGEKPFKCDSCDYASNVRSSLKTHKIVKHSDSSNFKCRECKKDFKTATLVRQHYKGVHFALDFADDCIIKIT